MFKTITKISCLVWLLFVNPLYAEKVIVSVTDLRAESGLSGAVVEVVPLTGRLPEASTVVTSIDQVDKEFVSDVTIVTKGSRISFPNSDEILHHVYSFSQAKTFDIPLYGTDENLNHFESFDKPGIVEIGCNIHDWMLAYIYVAESGFAEKTDSSGITRLEGLEPGNYKVRIWHARMGGSEPVTREITIVPGADASVSITLDLAPERRIRRTPSSARGRYR